MKTFLICLLLLFTSVAGAQIVNIPDANFKAKLLAANTMNNIAKDNTGQNIVVDINADGEIQEAEALRVYELNVDNRSINSVEGLQAFVNLTNLICSRNNLTVLDVSALTNLTSIDCYDNSLASLNISPLQNLEVLDVTSNQLTELNVSYCPMLVELSCSLNALTQLNLSANTALETLKCESNNINFLYLSPVNLRLLFAGRNLFTTLDLSTQSNLSRLNLFECANLTSVYLKNGSVQNLDGETFYNCSNLNFVCVDESEIDSAYRVLSTTPGINIDNIQLTSYCSFTPGGNYNTITGTLRFDGNDNGCDTADATQSFIKVKLDDGTNTGYTFTGNDGVYNFYTEGGTFTVTPEFEDNQFYTATPTAATVIFPVVDNSVAIKDFCVTANGVHSDVEVVMVPLTNARPGFDATYKIVYKNKGNQILSGTVSCGWDTSVLYPVSLVPFPDGMAPDTYIWNYTNLQPFENREILMTLNVNSATDTPPVNSGDRLPFTAYVGSAYIDETPDDNYYEFNQPVVSSLDPNNIVCIEGDTETTDAIGEYLHYVVNFENTGTASASFVVVTHDVDPTEFDINTVEILNSSNEVKARIRGNRLEFAFMNVNLGVADHGNILFKLKSRASLQEGDRVVNQANIFFDYNRPVTTNEASTVFAVLSSGNFIKDATVQVYPNPAKENITVKADGNIISLELYDVQGRLLQTNLVNKDTVVIDVSSRTAGMYFLKVTTDRGVMVEKIVKE